MSKEKDLEFTSLILPLIRDRYSPRAFCKDKILPNECVEQMIEGARWAPSSYGEEPWRFFFSKREEDSFEVVLSCLVPFNQDWAKNASLFVVVCSYKRSSKVSDINMWAEYDTGAAAYGMCLVAHSLGLVCHQMGGFDRRRIKNAIGLDEDTVPMSVIAIGYAEKNSDKPKRTRQPTATRFMYLP